MSEKLVCSECGGDDLSAWYPQTERQTITVWRDDEHKDVRYDYTGETESVGDADADFLYQCHDCGRMVDSIEELVGDPIPPAPRKWTFVWETTEGPSLGGIYPSEEAAMAAAFEEWDGFQGGTVGGWDEGTRKEFDEVYGSSADIWVVPLSANAD